MPTYLEYKYIFFFIFISGPDPDFFQADPDPWKKMSDPHPWLYLIFRLFRQGSREKCSMKNEEFRIGYVCWGAGAGSVFKEVGYGSVRYGSVIVYFVKLIKPILQTGAPQRLNTRSATPATATHNFRLFPSSRLCTPSFTSFRNNLEKKMQT